MAKQGELIPMSAEERRAPGMILARLTLELEDAKADHADAKKEMAARERDLALRIRQLARTIRDGRDQVEAAE